MFNHRYLKMSTQNRKNEYDRLVEAGRIREESNKKLMDEFGDPGKPAEVAQKTQEAEKKIAKEKPAIEKRKHGRR